MLAKAAELVGLGVANNHFNCTRTRRHHIELVVKWVCHWPQVLVRKSAEADAGVTVFRKSIGELHQGELLPSRKVCLA